MNYPFATNTECKSGCESGWTSYLENSYISSQCASAKYKVGKFVDETQRIKETEEEEEEDLSMVSDASSGPPLFHENEYNSNGTYNAPALLTKNANTEKGKKNRRSKSRKQSSLLDDTASSSVCYFSNNNCDSMNNETVLRQNIPNFSQGYSTTQFHGASSSSYQEPCLSDGDQHEIICRSSDDAESCSILGRG